MQCNFQRQNSNHFKGENWYLLGTDVPSWEKGSCVLQHLGFRVFHHRLWRHCPLKAFQSTLQKKGSFSLEMYNSDRTCDFFFFLIWLQCFWQVLTFCHFVVKYGTEELWEMQGQCFTVNNHPAALFTLPHQGRDDALEVADPCSLPFT